MAAYPEKLAELVEDMESITDRRERADLLIEIADRFDEVQVPADVATKPYRRKSDNAPACESEAYVWAVDQPDGTLKYYFDVLNPQGLSAMAMSVILGRNASPVSRSIRCVKSRTTSCSASSARNSRWAKARA